MYKIYGQITDLSLQFEELEEFDLVIDEKQSKAVETSSNRGQAELIELGELDDYDIISVEFEDGGVWMFTPEQYAEYVITQSSRGSEDLIIEPYLDGGTRGIGNIKERLIEYVKFRLIGASVGFVAQKLEELTVMPQEGLFRVDEDFELQQYDANSVEKGRCLLLLHGTLSNTTRSFGGLTTENKYAEIFKDYEGNVIALQHKTLTKSVVENARDLLEALPDNIHLDILSHSRGGLIGEVLNAICEVPKPIWNNPDDNNDIVHRLKLQALKADFAKKNIKVNKIVRVACPAGGTSLLGENIPNFFQVFNNLTKPLEKGGVYGKLFKGLKILISVLLKQKNNPDALPGIYSMVPNGDFIKTLNTSEFFDTPVFVISGSIKKGKLKDSIKLLLTHWIYGRANDLVVDTISMKGGLRRNRLSEYHCKSSITHFEYFSHAATRQAITRALSAPKDTVSLIDFDLQLNSSLNRGLINMGETPKNPVLDELGGKPVIVLVPGILGSTLSYDDELLWVNAIKLFDGGIGKIDLHNSEHRDKISVTGGVGDFYNKIIDHFSRIYDVVVFPYDWRKCIEAAGKLFIEKIKEIAAVSDEAIHIVAHSMGGLVAREFMIYEKNLQIQLEKQGGKIIMLGTPWKGSYLIPQTLNADGKRFNQLRKLAFCSHAKKELLEVIANFDGIYSLLPMYGKDFDEKEIWDEFKQSNADFVGPTKRKLDWFKSYKNKILANEETLHYSNLHYIAGYNMTTVDDFEIENDGVVFKSELKRPGDGSVTWESGIPRKLSRNRVYFTKTDHGELCNESNLFNGIGELLQSGSTDDIYFYKNSTDVILLSASRGGLPIVPPAVYSNDPNDIIKDVLGLKAENRYDDADSSSSLSIQIVNGHLKYSSYPVLIGHFHKDAIVSAEYVMDFLSGYQLSQRNSLGVYPGHIGTSFVLPSGNASNPGAVILGLGKLQDINPQRLQYTVEQGVIEYLLHPDTKNEKGISTLLIGSGFGNLVISESINAIIKAIVNGNKRFRELFPNGNQIANLEIIELYKDKAEQAYEFIQENHRIYSKNDVRLKRKVEYTIGRREWSQYGKEKKWWKSITVKHIEDEKQHEDIVEFTLSSDVAKVNQNTIKVDVSLVDRMIGEITADTEWDHPSIQAAFKVLIPFELRLLLNGNSSIIWVLDLFAARYPWELLFFPDVQRQPTSVLAGMVRQLVSTNDDRTVTYVNTKSICVIADPLLDQDKAPADLSFGQLPSAKKEGEMVHQLFKQYGYKESRAVIGKTERDILPVLLLNRFKVLHFACHGVVDFGPAERTGIVLDYDSFITPDIFSNFDYMPDFIFVNCCYGGFIGSGKQNRFSANIGTMLIQKGVKAVIVGAWEVGDRSALYFAKEFYSHFLNDEYFGEAVRKARSACFNKFGGNTWAAYQCYGNQYYQLDSEQASTDGIRRYNLIKDIRIDLEILMNDTALSRKRSKDNCDILNRLYNISTGIDHSKLRNAKISELEARIYMEIGDYKTAIECFEKMFREEEHEHSARAINFYKVYKAKQLSAAYKTADESDDTKTDCINEIEILKDEAEQMYNNYPTKDNGVMYASVIKSRLAMIYNRDFDRLVGRKFDQFIDHYIDELETLFIIYQHLNTNQNGDSRKDDTHSSSLLIVLSGLVSNDLAEIKGGLSQHFEEDIDIFLEAMMTNRSKLRNRNFWDEIKRINILEAQLSLLDGNEEDKMKAIVREIKSIYSEAWTFGGSRRNIKSEIDQMAFMINAGRVTGAYPENLIVALEKLRQFFIGLERDSF